MPKLADLVEYAIWIALIVLGVWALQFGERLGCPHDAFICGSASFNPRTWAGLCRVILLLVCLVYPVKIVLFYATRNRFLSRHFKKQHKAFNLGKAVARGVLLAVVGMVAIYLLTFDKVWASPGTIFAQENIWSTPVKRKWSDVVSVMTWCSPGGRGSWDEGYELTFRDGVKVNLASNAGPLADHKKAIFSALHGVTLDFDDSAVNENCMSDFREMATERPG